MKRLIFGVALVLLPWSGTMAVTPADNFNLYGTVWNAFSFHSRDGVYDRGGLMYLLPADFSYNEVNLDMNNEFCSEYSARFSTIGMEWSMLGTTSVKACLEADFYGNGSGSYGIRFRKAYASAVSLVGKRFSARALAGIDWHPMSVDMPVMVSQSKGAPFNPYNFSPQAALELGVGNHASLMASALWQMDFNSLGPDGYSSKYIEWSQIPELFAGVHLYGNGWNVKAGADFLQIKPRQMGQFPFTQVYVWVNDKVSSLSFFAYADVATGCFKFQAKSILSRSGEHLGLLGGYAWSRYFDDGSYGYCRYSTLSNWLCISASPVKWLEPSLFIGYSRNLGTDGKLWNTAASSIFYSLDACNFRQTAAAVPGLQLHWEQLTLGLEYSLQAVEYGDRSQIDSNDGLAGGQMNRVFAHSVTTSVSFDF